MPIDPEHLSTLRVRGERLAWDARTTILHALATGFARDPVEPAELPFVTDHPGLRTVPTMAALLLPLAWLDDCGWEAARVVPEHTRLALDRPLPEAAVLLVDSEVGEVSDRGAEGGAAITVVSRARREADGQPVFTLWRTLLARGDGGFGGPRRTTPALHPVPDRPHDLQHLAATRTDQALLYGLLGRPLALPLLPPAGLLGIACHAVLRVICEYDHTLIQRFAARHAGEARAGEALRCELWQDANIVSFRLVAADSNRVVLDHGHCELKT